jgi:hypothetical protein
MSMIGSTASAAALAEEESATALPDNDVARKPRRDKRRMANSPT